MSSNADIYHEIIVDYSRNPINYGEIKDHDVTFHDSNPLCGDSIDIDMKIDDDKITDIKFHGKGCAICMACSSVLTEITKGKSLEDVRKIEKNDVLILPETNFREILQKFIVKVVRCFWANQNPIFIIFLKRNT